MRILNLEAGYFVSCFRKMGHTVLSIGSRSDCDIRLTQQLSAAGLIELLKTQSFCPDIILWADGCQIPSIFGFEIFPCPTIGFSIDQYCNPWHVPWSFCFDAFLVAQKDYLPLFASSDSPRTAEWFPLFFKAANPPSEPTKRDIPISFVGTVSGTINTARQNFLSAVSKRVPLFVHSGNFLPIYGRSQIVLNQSAAGEINFRFFEGPGCGALLVTEKTENGLAELLTPNEEILLYERQNATDAIRVCHEILATPERLQEMAAAAKRRVLREHGVTTRARQIIQLAKKLLQEKSWQWRLQNRNFVSKELAKTFTFLGTDTKLPLPSKYSKQLFELGVQLFEQQE